MKEAVPHNLCQTEPLKRLSVMISELSELQGQLLDIKQALIEKELQKYSDFIPSTRTENILIPF